MFSYFWGRANSASKGTPYFLERSFIAQKTVQFSLKITQHVPENGMWLTLPETVKPGFLFFQNHLHSNPHVGSIHIPPQQVCRSSREPVRPDTIARGLWTIFQTRPLVVAFADISGADIPGALALPPLSARKRSHGPRSAGPGALAGAHLVDAPSGPGCPWGMEQGAAGLLSPPGHGRAPGPAQGTSWNPPPSGTAVGA